MWSRWAIIAVPVVEMLTIVRAFMLTREPDLLQQGPTTALRVTLFLTLVLSIIALIQSAASARLSFQMGLSLRYRLLYAGGSIGGLALIWFLASNNLAL